MMPVMIEPIANLFTFAILIIAIAIVLLGEEQRQVRSASVTLHP